MSYNESSANAQRLWRTQRRTPFVKDSIHETVVNRAEGKVNPQGVDTKVAAHYRMVIAPGTTQTAMLRLAANRPQAPFDDAAELFTTCIEEANDFYLAVGVAA